MLTKTDFLREKANDLIEFGVMSAFEQTEDCHPFDYQEEYEVIKSLLEERGETLPEWEDKFYSAYEFIKKAMNEKAILSWINNGNKKKAFLRKDIDQMHTLMLSELQKIASEQDNPFFWVLNNYVNELVRIEKRVRKKEGGEK